ncbi:DUF4328 domain-containing protein [Gordonia alkaliphila]|uniref:DUF4328 domain-containing protein n=1 Tax=Gordonia alkaliphila TaxID=1053547 RepID=A0ABP8Z072_9ACTN
MLDVCLRCQIQADHLPGRTTCPRCGGKLSVLDAQTRRSVPMPAQSAPAQSPPAQSPPTQYPPGQPSARVPQRPRPAGRPQPQTTRAPLRWVAHRPLNTLPPARPVRPAARIGTPRYTEVPRWGLRDVGVPPGDDNREAKSPGARLRWALQIIWPVLAVAAALQLLRYCILMFNRSHPIPYWLDLASLWLLLISGAVAVAAAVWGLFLFARWLLAARERSYETVETSDPRRRWLIIAGAVLPFVNVLTAPLLLLEAAAAVGPAQAARVRPAINRVAVAWGLVNGLALIALVYRIVAWSSGSIQVGADAMVATLVTFVASGIFVAWLVPRLDGLVATDLPSVAPARRFVVAA